MFLQWYNRPVPKSAHTALDRVPDAPAGAPVCLLAKVGEASLKGRNKRHFLDALRRNTRAALRGLDARVEGGGSVFLIPVPDELVAAEAAARLERVFGFVTGSVCLRCERDTERITEVGMVAFARAQPRTFAVRVRRRDKAFHLTSQEIERLVGAAIQERTALPVDLSRPDLELRVELDAHGAYVHVRELAGRGRAAGRHQRPRGRVALRRHRLSRCVAARDEAGPGGGVHPFQRGAVPRPDRDREGAGPGAGAERLSGCPPGAMWVVPFGHQQRMLSAVSTESHRIVLYRRQMARIACALAERLRAAALVTGDSLGQVSSQTLTNMTLTEEASDLPVLRPLLAWDKREVMAKAASLGILSLSELPADDACPLFAGGKQRTAVPRADVLAAESQLDLDALAQSAAVEARRIEPGVMLDPLQPEPRAK